MHFGILSAALCAFALPIYQLRGAGTAAAHPIAGDQNPCIQANENCAPFQELNQHARPGERICLAGYCGYWLRTDFSQCANDVEESEQLMRATDIHLALSNMGFDYLALDHSSHLPISRKSNSSKLFPGVTLLAADQDMTTYRLPSYAARSRQCLELRYGEWQSTAPLTPMSEE